MTIAILSFFIGILSGIMNGVVGGGGGTIAVPLLILIGLPPYTAVSTPKLAAVGVAVGSLTEFWGKNYIRWSYIPVFMTLAIVAAIVGANLLLATPEWVLNKIVAVLLVASVIIMNVDKQSGIVEKTVTKVQKFFGYIAFFIVEGLRAAFGSGFGMFTSTVLVYLFGMTMLESSATKRISGVVVSAIAFVVYFFKGIIDFHAGIGLLIGATIGSYLGTRYAIKIGDVWIKRIFTGFAVIMAILLLVSNNITFS